MITRDPNCRWDIGGHFEHLDARRRLVLTPTFHSWDAFINQVAKGTVQSGSSDTDCQYDSHYGGTKDLEDCLELARKGWPHGRDKLVKFKGELDNIVTGGVIKADTYIAEAGDEVEIGRYLDHEPECMINYRMREFSGGKGGRVAKLLVNVTSSAGIDSPMAYLRGAVALSFIDALERYGYRVELWIGEVGIQDGSASIFLRTCLKKAQEDYDIDLVAFAMCHPAVQRRMFFRLYEQVPQEKWNVESWRYGGGGTFNDPDPEVIEFGYLWHTRQGGTINNINDAQEAFSKSLKTFGLEIEETITTT